MQDVFFRQGTADSELLCYRCPLSAQAILVDRDVKGTSMRILRAICVLKLHIPEGLASRAFRKGEESRILIRCILSVRSWVCDSFL